ncbi:MAG TPA: pirin family protein [Puia sp.]|nr:pirin family protein [Puia sp.]
MTEGSNINSGGRNERVADLLLNRLLPNEQIMKVGPFVSLGHVYPILFQKQEPEPYRGQHAHPNRGMVTLSYVLSGSLQHIDSHHNRGVINSGGLLWRKAGNGIIHDERPSTGFLREGGLLHIVKFWINLPGINKEETPECRALAAADIPELELPDNAGVLKVLLGSCGVLQSRLKTFLNEFIYHIRLNPKSSFSYPAKQDLEYAAFVPADDIRINDLVMGNSHLLVFSRDEASIQLYNPGISITDVFVFGGQEYLEPIVIGGPFVMNSRNEVAQAYGDFFAGRYGELSFDHPL